MLLATPSYKLTNKDANNTRHSELVCLWVTQHRLVVHTSGYSQKDKMSRCAFGLYTRCVKLFNVENSREINNAHFSALWKCGPEWNFNLICSLRKSFNPHFPLIYTQF